MFVGAGGANAITRPLEIRLASVEGHLNSHMVELRRLNKTNVELTKSNEQMSRLVLGLLKGTIKPPVSAAAPAYDSVPRAIFDSHAAETDRALAVLRQDIVGGGYSIMDREFNVLQDSVTFCRQHFPPDKDV